MMLSLGPGRWRGLRRRLRVTMMTNAKWSSSALIPGPARRLSAWLYAARAASVKGNSAGGRPLSSVAFLGRFPWLLLNFDVPRGAGRSLCPAFPQKSRAWLRLLSRISPCGEKGSHSSEKQGLTKARDGGDTGGDDLVLPALVGHGGPLPGPQASRYGQEV